MKLSNNQKKWVNAIVIAVLIMCIGLAGCKNKNASPKYYLNIPDSPQVKAWLEIDYTSNDTAYCNWYAKPDLYTIRINANGVTYNPNDSSLSLMDGDRVVSTFTDNKLDSIILNDNQ